MRTLVTSSLVLRTPPDSAFRHAPTPLVFVSAKDWDPSSHDGSVQPILLPTMLKRLCGPGSG